jgi:AraC-like DNA-binding protein
MEFTLSDKQPDAVTATVPLQYHYSTVPDAQRICKRYRQAIILRQLIQGWGFTLVMHRLWISETVRLRMHSPYDTLSLFFVRKGKLELQIPGNIRLPFEELSYRLIQVNAGANYEIEAAPQDYDIVHIIFPIDPQSADAAFKPESFPVPNGVSPRVQRPFSMSAEIRETLAEMINSVHEPRQRKLLIESGVRQVLRLYLQAYYKRKEEEGSGTALTLLQQMEEYIDSHLDAHLTVKELAMQMGRSRSWLQRICGRYFEKGIYELIQEKRMREAARLLLHSDAAVSEIVLKVSDMTFSAFSAAFKKYFHQTPRQYRKNRGQNQ